MSKKMFERLKQHFLDVFIYVPYVYAATNIFYMHIILYIYKKSKMLKNIERKNFFTGSRKLPMCNRTHFRIGSIIRSLAGLRSTRADSVEAKICDIFISYCIRRFRNCDGVRYGNIGDYAYDKDAKRHNF